VHSQRKVLRILFGCFLGLGFLQAEAVPGSTFKVNPIQIAFSGPAKSALLTLTNESDETLRFEVTAFAWDQSPKGDVKLQPTEDIVFFPKLFSVPPGKERKIRVGTTATVAGTEKTYRIFVEELRPLEKPKQPPTGSQVRILTKMGIPIFLQPPKPNPAGGIASLAVVNGVVSFEIRNTGNVHFSLYGVRVVGTAAPGETVFERKAEGWYVLAGGSRAYDMSLSQQECSRLKHIVAEAETNIGAFKDQLDVAPGACGTPTPAGAALPVGMEHGGR
jgi:fimbrial chaperone protein